MKLQHRFLLLLVLLHLSVGILCATLLWQDHRPFIFLLEALLGLSLWLFMRLVRANTLPLEIIADGSHFIRESDFTHTFVPSGSVEVNRLVELYNTLIVRLRDERHRQQEQHFFLEKVLEVSPAGIVTFTPDHRADYANPAARLMLDGDRGTTRLTRNTPIPPLPAELERAWRELNEGASSIVSLPGRKRVRLSRSSFLDQGFPRAVMILEELTKELMATERAAWEKLIRTLSHEINNSLGASQSLLRSCLEYARHLPEEERQEFQQALTVVMERGRHLSQFMNSYADVVRLPAPVPRLCDVMRVLQDLVSLQEPELGSRGIRLETRLDVSHWQALLDRPQLEQALINILRNAADALAQRHDTPGIIRISASEEQRQLLLEIADNGPGLSPGALENLFTPFFTTRPNGQGIGLTLVRDILGNHGLRFTLENSSEGGAVFRLWIPAA